MTFGDYFEELRAHLWRAIAGFGVALFISFFIGQPAVNFISAPVHAHADHAGHAHHAAAHHAAAHAGGLWSIIMAI
jgi:hypothetical protein